jgi:endonuclease-3
MNKRTVEALFRNLSASIAGPVTELDYLNPYTLLVAVVLSAQATDAGVNKATEPLFRLVDTPAKMLDLGEEKLTGYIRTIGLFRTKAKNVMALSRLLVERHGGEVPRTHDELQALPGVGRKTANVVLNVAFGQPTIAVDTHVFRVANRTGLAHGKTPDQIETGLMKVVPKAYLKDAHHLLILHGRYVCKARRPECPDCAIRDQCEFKDKTTLVELKKKGGVPAEPAST